MANLSELNYKMNNIWGNIKKLKEEEQEEKERQEIKKEATKEGIISTIKFIHLILMVLATVILIILANIDRYNNNKYKVNKINSLITSNKIVETESEVNSFLKTANEKDIILIKGTAVPNKVYTVDNTKVSRVETYSLSSGTEVNKTDYKCLGIEIPSNKIDYDSLDNELKLNKDNKVECKLTPASFDLEAAIYKTKDSYIVIKAAKELQITNEESWVYTLIIIIIELVILALGIFGVIGFLSFVYETLF